MTARPVCCDTCAGPLAGLAGAVVRARFDGDGVVVGLLLIHDGHSPRPGEMVEDHAASAFIAAGGSSVARFRDLARVSLGASLSRILGRVARLAATSQKTALPGAGATADERAP